MGANKWRSLEGGGVLFQALASGLILAGVFALGLAGTGRFLPHDEHFLGMTSDELCAVHGCRIVHFMIHDRVSFGGAIIAIGLLYLWLAAVPLRAGQTWAWWLLLLSGAVGFLSFFAYLGFGYLDVWHGVATVLLLPCFIGGLVLSRSALPNWESMRCLAHSSVRLSRPTSVSFGRHCLLATSLGITAAGLTIMVVGMTCVFVPQDLEYMGLSVHEMEALNPRLIPLIAHDRAGFGGAVCCCGLTLFFCIWKGVPSPSLWWTLCLVGIVGFGSAIGVHPAIGYTDVVHLAPAVLGALTYVVGLTGAFRRMLGSKQDNGERGTQVPRASVRAGTARLFKDANSGDLRPPLAKRD